MALRKGQVFGKRTVIGPGVSKRKGTGKNTEMFYPVRCECGTEDLIRRSSLVQGDAMMCKSCKGKANKAKAEANRHALKIAQEKLAVLEAKHVQYRRALNSAEAENRRLRARIKELEHG